MTKKSLPVALIAVVSFFFQSNFALQPVGVESDIKTYYDRQVQFPDHYIHEVQHNIEQLIEYVQGVEEAIPVVGPISSMSNTSSYKTVKSLHSQLELLTMQEIGERVDAIRLASLYKLSIPLIIDMNNKLLNQICELDELLAFWSYADEHDWHHFFHKNPLKWFDAGQAQKVKNKVRKLKQLKKLYTFHLGRLVMQTNSFQIKADVKTQYAWFVDLYNILIACLPKQKMLTAQSSFEAVSALFGRAISSVTKFSNHCQKELQPYAIPSWLEQQWMTFGSLAAALTFGAPLAVKHSGKVVDAAESVGTSVKMFGDGAADALWGKDQKWDKSLKEKEELASRHYEGVLLRLLPYYTKDEPERLKLVKELVERKFQDDKYTTELNAEKELAINQKDLKRPDLPIIMKKIRESKSFNLQEIAQLELKGKSEKEVLENLYCGIYGGDSLPDVKQCIDSIDTDCLKRFTRSEITKAAYGSGSEGPLSTTYLTKTFLPLLMQTLDKEGTQISDATKEALKILADTEMGQGQNAWIVLNHMAPKLFKEQQTNKKYKEITEGIQAALKTFENSSNVIDTASGLPSEVAMGFDVALVKTERRIYNGWKAAKVPIFVTLSYILYKAFKDEAAFGWRMMKHMMPKKSYDGILQALQELTLLFNIYGKASLSQMEPHDVGLMHYLIDKLEQQEELIPPKYRESFMNNVRLLQAPDLSAKQKYNIVTDAIFNRYPFLREAHSTA